MTIPFLDYFKKKTPQAPPMAPVPPRPPVDKPDGEKLSKTVLPNSTRTVGPQESFEVTDTPPPVTPAARHSMAFAPSGPVVRMRDLPPAIALALEPRVERTVTLNLTDIIPALPPGIVRGLEAADADRPVLLKASEVERGMAKGKPTVSIATIYQQVPEIFLKEIAPSDQTQIELPFQKVLEEFGKLHVRNDQSFDQSVPQLETPFLKVTLEDDERFGTLNGPIEGPTSDLPPVRVELATAETLAAAEPEATATEKFVVTAKTPQSGTPSAPRSSNGRGQNKAAAPAAPKTPTRIPFQLSPTGTDAPATERVPASRGPSVPNGASPAAPTRIPFKLGVPAEELTEKAEPWLTKDNFAGAPASPAPVVLPSPASQNTISLPLLPILQSLLPVQLAGDASEVPESARIEFPTTLLESQLAKGRVSVSPTEFASCLPEKYRSLFSAEATEAAVALPLHEVLKNLPSAALQMRSDQVEDERGRDFATPFSAKADEDAKRFEAPTTPEPEKRKAASAPAPASAKTPAPVVAKETPALVPAQTAVTPSVPEPVKRSALQEMLETDDEVDAKKAIEYVGQQAGVKACAVHFRDGLSLAGKLPAELGVEGLSAMAPSLLLKIENHMSESTLGPLQTMTLCCAQGAISFFTHGNLCLTALHENVELASETRARVTEVVRELSVNYSQPL